jgi:hypothetical protein
MKLRKKGLHLQLVVMSTNFMHNFVFQKRKNQPLNHTIEQVKKKGTTWWKQKMGGYNKLNTSDSKPPTQNVPRDLPVKLVQSVPNSVSHAIHGTLVDIHD